jgi:uncharacterized protein (DUF2252 family)
VQLCGDAHLSNFGLFGTPERRMLFDINDFDETLPGPWEWDIKRLAASFEIMGPGPQGSARQTVSRTEGQAVEQMAAKGQRGRRQPSRAGSHAVRAHLRSDPRPGPCPVGRPDRDRRLPGPGDVFDRAIADFAAVYAD